ncbi:hypothetical protein B296_00045229 [Ensete ventricosum]|uniref:Uncharacterized protein n=1 Tax=Ensete ventricosum TaxID=4639 RepID=A0A426YR81_ENSVE|nr:hypothetical protein B296_00045229 [Ensete ventricosum]
MLHMGWLRSLFSPLKKLWIRLHSARRKSTCSLSLSLSIASTVSVDLSFSLFHVGVCDGVDREGDIHSVRGREVVPIRRRADPVVDRGGVAPPRRRRRCFRPRRSRRGGKRRGGNVRMKIERRDSEDFEGFGEELLGKKSPNVDYSGCIVRGPLKVVPKYLMGVVPSGELWVRLCVGHHFC